MQKNVALISANITKGQVSIRAGISGHQWSVFTGFVSHFKGKVGTELGATEIKQESLYDALRCLSKLIGHSMTT